MKEFKQCGCGKRIPSDWASCVPCQERAERDLFEGDFDRRMERAQLVRVRRGMDFTVESPLSPEEQQLLLDGIARQQQQEHILHMKHQIEAYQHIQVLWANAMAHRQDILELAESEWHAD
jgi:hypothetical protein